jgi:hypothetical protein
LFLGRADVKYFESQDGVASGEVVDDDDEDDMMGSGKEGTNFMT